MSAHRENPAKIYVSVRADHLLNGRIRPLMFRAKDGPVVRIDRILDEREAPSLKAGGQGMRYTCRSVVVAHVEIIRKNGFLAKT